MGPKEKAIETLESTAHWMKTSSFDYDDKSLKILLNCVFRDYTRYLKEKKVANTIRTSSDN